MSPRNPPIDAVSSSRIAGVECRWNQVHVALRRLEIAMPGEFLNRPVSRLVGGSALAVSRLLEWSISRPECLLAMPYSSDILHARAGLRSSALVASFGKG